MARDLNEFERIAVAITAAMRNNVEPLKALLADLKAAGHTDYTIGEMFMSVGAIVFDEGDVITEDEEEMKKNSGELIAEALQAERGRIIKLLQDIAWEDYGIDGRGYYESESQAVWLDEAIALIKEEKND